MKNLTLQRKYWNVSLLGANITLFLLAFLVNDPLDLFNKTYANADKLFKEFSVESIQKIQVKGEEGQPFTFQKDDGKWTVFENKENLYPADESRVIERLERLVDIRDFQVVTTSKERQQDFEVTDQNFSLSLTSANGEQASIILGKSGASFNSTLVRLTGDDTVYSVKGNLRSDWNQSVSFFRNRKIIQFSAGNLKSVSFSGPQNYQLTRNQANQWSTTAVTNDLDNNAINNHLNSISDTIALDFSDSDFSLEKPYGVIKLTFKNNEEKELIIRGPDQNSEFLVQSEEGKDTFTLSKYKAESFFKDVKSFELAQDPSE